MGRSQWLNALIPAAGQALIQGAINSRATDKAYQRKLEMIARAELQQQEADRRQDWKESEERNLRHGRLNAQVAQQKRLNREMEEEKARKQRDYTLKQHVGPVAELLEKVRPGEASSMYGKSTKWTPPGFQDPRETEYEKQFMADFPDPAPEITYASRREVDDSPEAFGQRARDFISTIPKEEWQAVEESGRLTYPQRVRLKMIDYMNHNRLDFNKMSRQQVLKADQFAREMGFRSWDAMVKYAQSPIGGVSGVTPPPSPAPSGPAPTKLPIDPYADRTGKKGAGPLGAKAPRSGRPGAILGNKNPPATQADGPPRTFAELQSMMSNDPRYQTLKLDPEKFRQKAQALAAQYGITK